MPGKAVTIYVKEENVEFTEHLQELRLLGKLVNFTLANTRDLTKDQDIRSVKRLKELISLMRRPSEDLLKKITDLMEDHAKEIDARLADHVKEMHHAAKGY